MNARIGTPAILGSALLALIGGGRLAAQSQPDLADPGRAIVTMRGELAKSPEWADGWSILGRLADRVGDYALGVDAGRRAVDLHLAAKRNGEAVRAQADLADRHRKFGNSETEIAARIRLRELQVQAGMDTSYSDAAIRELEGRIRERPDPPARMRELAEAARKAGNPSLEHAWLVRLAYALWLEKDFAEGAACYERVLALHSKFPVSEIQKANDLNGAARLSLELALASERPKRGALLEKARTWAETALAAHEKEAGVLAPIVWDHCVLGHIAEAEGRDKDALRHHETELACVLRQREGIDGENDRALRIFNAERFHIFEDFALFLARGSPSRPPDLQRALAVSDQGRVGALEELLKLRGVETPSWTSAKLDAEALKQSARGARAAFVVFLRGSHDAGAITVTGAGLRFSPLGPVDSLDATGRTFSASVLDVATRPADLDQAATAAYDAFLAKALPDDATITRLVVTGAGAISALPFGAMAKPGKEPLARRHLALRWEIGATTSLASLRTGAGAPGRPLEVVSVGFNGGGALYDPALAAHYGITALEPLQGAEKECSALGAALGARVLKGAEATELAFRSAASAAGLLHVASHAIVDEVDGSRTALLLAPDPGKSDGILTIGDILELRLSAQLVILSGCRTAVGGAFRGESVGGLARAVLGAGARNLVASVGPVDDQTAPKLVTALAQGVKAGQPVASAFASAQRKMLADPRTAHPALWAPFILFGQSDLLK